MKSYVINLDGSHDRWRNVESQLQGKGFELIRIPAIYGKSIDHTAWIDDEACRRYMGRSIQPGEVGCFLSHQKALQAFMDSGDAYGIIFEDDVAIDPMIHERIKPFVANETRARFEGILAVNLGPSDYKYSTVAVTTGDTEWVVAHRFPMLATGILWSRAGARYALDQMAGKKIWLPYDNFLRYIFTGRNDCYSIRPGLANVGHFASDIQANNITKNRSKFQRSNWYFWIKQKRVVFEKLLGLWAMIKYRLLRQKNKTHAEKP